MIRCATYPAAPLFASSTGKKAVGQLLWGDYVKITGAKRAGRYPVRSRKDGWVDERSLQKERLLEIVFVDIGQGDGALLVTPDDHKMLIDAGAGDNMFRFLRWRFGKFQRSVKFSTVVISHGDQDHWGGFGQIFSEPNLSFGTVYHNGLVERAGAKSASLGPRRTSGGADFVTGIVADTDDLRRLVRSPAKVGKKKYAAMFKALLESGRVGSVRSLGRTADRPRFLPGFGSNNALSIEVLGPIIEPIGTTPALRWLGDVGKTKNGHSVVLKLRYRGVSILLGGDLNTPAEDVLLSTHTGLRSPAVGPQAELAMITAARRVFQSDFAKACHHGSADFSSVFLSSINPIATIVSSGDEESYAHPRPDALGAYGLAGRGERPLIFSTELFRSSAERIKYPNRFRKEILGIVDEMLRAQASGNRKSSATQRKRLEDHIGDLDRSVAVYGAINLRTDGRRVLMAYRIERPTRPDKKWDLYTFEPGPTGGLERVRGPVP
jgi:beta-lactamase superfamily II metal-dependent hydrolase